MKHEIESKNTISYNNAVPMEEYRKLLRENAELKDKEIKYAETIRHLKN